MPRPVTYDLWIDDTGKHHRTEEQAKVAELRNKLGNLMDGFADGSYFSWSEFIHKLQCNLELRSEFKTFLDTIETNTQGFSL